MNLNVILVGSNPLPCYIQAAYMLGERPELETIYGNVKESDVLPKPDKLLFIVTEGSKKQQATDIYADYIKELLDKKSLVTSDMISVKKLKNGRDASEIIDAVKEEIIEINEKSSHPIRHIVINNTGGTKPMATYTTMIIEKLEFYSSIDVVNVYVDPEVNKLRCYIQKSGVKGLTDSMELFPRNGDLRNYVKTSVAELVQLHFGAKCEVKSSDENGSDFEGKALKGASRELALKILSDDNALKAYDKLDTVARGMKRKWRDVIKKLDEICRENPDIQELLEELSDIEEKKEILKKFSDGFWLESYCYEAVLMAKKRLEEKGISIETAWSCKIKPGDNKKTFELDILILHGYELTLFSISMADSQSLAKGKWFEAVYRIEQIAGEHGQAKVVNFLRQDELSEFKKDLGTFDNMLNLDTHFYDRDLISDQKKFAERLAEDFQ